MIDSEYPTYLRYRCEFRYHNMYIKYKTIDNEPISVI